MKPDLIKWAAGAVVGLATAAVVKRIFDTKAAAVAAPVMTIVAHRLLDEPVERTIRSVVGRPSSEPRAASA